MKSRAILIVGFACAAGAASVPASAAESTWQRESKQWFETIEPEGAVRVINPLGNVHARFGGYEPRVEILASVQHDAARHRAPAVEIDSSGGGLLVSTRRAGSPTGESTGPDERVDLVVFVPEGSPLDVETVAGDVEIKGLHGDAAVRSVEGDIVLRSNRGAVVAKTARGRISATLVSRATERPQNLSTETGEIEVHLFDDADLSVGIATSGEISTDFSIEIRHRRFEEPGKLGKAVVGDGTRELELRSKQGRVRLLRLEREEAPEIRQQHNRPNTR